MVIVAGNHKGGVGKTTLVATLAHVLRLLGISVSVLDLDAPSSIKASGAAQAMRKVEALGIPAYTIDTLPNEVEGHLLVDGPPDITDEGLGAALGFADLLLVPTSLSDDDLEVSKIFYESTDVASKKIIVTMVPHHSLKELSRVKAEWGREGIEFTEAYVREMKIFKHATKAGTTVAGINTYPGRAAARAYYELVEELAL